MRSCIRTSDSCARFLCWSVQILFVLLSYKPFNCVDNVNCAYNSGITAVGFPFIYINTIMICVLMDFMIYNVPLLVPPYSFLMLELVQLYRMIMDSKAFSVFYLVLFLLD